VGGQVAVVGLGVMGTHHARVYAEHAVLSAVCDIDSSRTAWMSAQYGVDGYSSIDSLLSDHSPLAVSIAVPTPLHAEIATKCLLAGVHIMLEKPICEGLEEARRLVELADGLDLVLAVGYIERFNPAFRALQALVDEGAFGEITSISIKRVGGTPRSADNVVLDLMTHDFNLLMALFGREPISVSTHSTEANGIINSAQVLLDFETASATCEANWISPVKIRRLEVTGTRGYCEVDMITQRVVRFGTNLADSVSGFQDFVAQYGDPVQQSVAVFRQEPLKEELSEFVEAIHTGQLEDLVTGADALRTLKITLQAARG